MIIGNGWDNILEKILKSDEFQNFYINLSREYDIYDVYPNYENIFNAFKLTKYEDIKIVIIGQDPYHQKGQANGLAFSVNSNIKTPPSLKNIFKEISSDLGIENKNPDLTAWAKQGVLLLNTILTVKDSNPRSYANSYWGVFSVEVIKKISERKNIIFMLWGNDAISLSKYIDEDNFILTSTHPSPLSAYRGFLGCKHFSKANEILEQLNKPKINWSTDENKGFR
ncbi:uracil-DNA glycosylase [Helcococcus ovis]|uniref:uracil-DNA glycosylase n=1 Tax=Helcococcus ovis TaxID=72026 RepID=UPI0038B84023